MPVPPGWRRRPDDLALADHLATALQPLESAYAALRDQATQLVADREDLWAPIALQLGEWVTHKRKALDQEPQLAVVKQALDWLKNNADVLRNQRIEPLAERAREIWATLRQESNVGLDAIRLAGENTNRRVELDADVDGVKAGAFGVMSQGELHALALALFLPRATAPESPFRFVVLDDPIQAMDPAKVEGFVAVMEKIAVDRQVIVLSHDDRLPDAVRRSGVKAQIYEVTRGVGSAVTMTNAFQPVDALPRRRFRLRQGRERARRGQEPGDPGPVPDGPRNHRARGVLDPFVHGRTRQTDRREAVGTTPQRSGRDWRWRCTPTRTPRSMRGSKVEARRSAAFHLCNSGVHAGSTSDHADDVNAVRTAVKDLRQTVT